jgi:hypothetical protein
MLNPNTGDAKMDEAYQKMFIYTSGFDSFEQFYNYFLKQVTTDDKDYLNKWLLKVLYVQMKQTKKHKFDELLEKVSLENKAQLESWLDSKLKEIRGV